MRTPTSEDIQEGPTRQAIREGQVHLTDLLEEIQGIEQGLYQGTAKALAARHRKAKAALRKKVRNVVKFVLQTFPYQTDSFFYALTTCGPRILADPDVLAVVEEWWFEKVSPSSWWGESQQSEREEIQQKLRRIGEALAQPGPGPFSRLLHTQKQVSKRQAASRARSLARWEQRHQENVRSYGPKEAWKQTKAEFESQARFRDPRQKDLTLKELKKRLKVS